jgi:hypoxanthine phosphoribosyltransferase
MERLRTLISATTIAGRIRQMGRELSRRYAGSEPLILVLLDGAAVFASDLMRACAIPGLRVHYCRASSYHGGRESSGTVELSGLPLVEGEDVLIVDDICDSGRTLKRLIDTCTGARSVHSCVLLDKPSRRAVDCQPDFIGFTVPDRFIVGYGLDMEERFRHLPDVCALEETQASESAGAEEPGR